MKILWIKTDFLHPTNRGGQIRTLEMLRVLHRRHEVHYLALDDGKFPEGAGRAGEYSSAAYAVAHVPPAKTSPKFAAQLVKGLAAELPLAISRWGSERMRAKLAELNRTHRFDAKVCDFLFPAVNLEGLDDVILFQHNVEATIWRRHAEHGQTALHRWYFSGQYERMRRFEERVCREARRVVAVSEADAKEIAEAYGVKGVEWVPTGVDVDYFAGSQERAQETDLVFIGSMDWMPNIDAALWFAEEILPRIRARRPETSVAFVGRQPTAEVEALAKATRGFRVTGTVPDVRPWLNAGRISIVPLRIGGGTRLKIYESMAAARAVVSTSVGAEGLDYEDGENLVVADGPERFAEACLRLLDNEAERERLGANARRFVRGKYSWESVTSRFEGYLAG